ncbi:MAG: HAMP domain-containing histidine kinase [Planctomycetes bacterium]|nr:HAMP domain-containing histidine kinase [Planctomycetota bacterium]
MAEFAALTSGGIAAAESAGTRRGSVKTRLWANSTLENRVFLRQQRVLTELQVGSGPGTVPTHFRKRRALRLPITLNVVLMSLNVALMVVWIILFANLKSWGGLAIGTVVFSLILVGLSFYLVITIKEVRLNQRQANFIDSVTHELKTPIASLRLYLETLQLRDLDDKQRHEFYAVMKRELERLDLMISQLLEVGRLNVIGQDSEPEEVDMEPLLRRCASLAATHQRCEMEKVFRFDCKPATVFGRRIVLEMIFGNLLDNAVKYGASDPVVEVKLRTNSRGRIVVEICDNGEGVPPEIRKKIFRIFYRGGSELERRRKGTGLGLYIARTLVHLIKGSIHVAERSGQPGSVFAVELPTRTKKP